MFCTISVGRSPEKLARRPFISTTMMRPPPRDEPVIDRVLPLRPTRSTRAVFGCSPPTWDVAKEKDSPAFSAQPKLPAMRSSSG